MRASLALLVLLAPAAAEAQGDGAYGRFDGDLIVDLALGGGAGIVDEVDGPAARGAATATARLRFLDAAGVMAELEWRPEGASRVMLGVDLRPLFLPRFFLGAITADRYWDILIDSIGLDLGVALTPLDDTIGVALAVGFGLDVPLVFFGHGADLLGLRLSARHVAALDTDRFGPDGGVSDWYVGAALVLRLQANLGAASWERERYELP